MLSMYYLNYSSNPVLFPKREYAELAGVSGKGSTVMEGRSSGFCAVDGAYRGVEVVGFQPAPAQVRSISEVQNYSIFFTLIVHVAFARSAAGAQKERHNTLNSLSPEFTYIAITAPIITGPKINEIFFHRLSFCLVRLNAFDPLL